MKSIEAYAKRIPEMSHEIAAIQFRLNTAQIEFAGALHAQNRTAIVEASKKVRIELRAWGQLLAEHHELQAAIETEMEAVCPK